MTSTRFDQYRQFLILYTTIYQEIGIIQTIASSFDRNVWIACVHEAAFRGILCVHFGECNQFNLKQLI